MVVGFSYYILGDFEVVIEKIGGCGVWVYRCWVVSRDLYFVRVVCLGDYVLCRSFSFFIVGELVTVFVL